MTKVDTIQECYIIFNMVPLDFSVTVGASVGTVAFFVVAVILAVVMVLVVGLVSSNRKSKAQRDINMK